MQKWGLKIQIVVLTIAACAPALADSQQILKQADSLFAQKKFTESRELYFQLYQAGQQSPAILLKMAYAHEGLGQFGEALFFLSEYYKMTEDNRAYEKITSLANAQNISGYEIGTLERATHWLNKRLYTILSVLAVISFFFIALTVWSMKRGNQNGQYVSGFVSILCIVLAGLALNFFTPPRNAVITQAGYFMSGPSAASNLLSIIPTGHKVEVKKYTDVWVEALWDKKTGYLRKTDLLEANQ